MALNDWEFSYNGLTFGGNQPFGLVAVEGLNPPDARVDEIERAGDHGSFIYAQFLTSRTITIDGDVFGTSQTEFETRLAQLRGAFAPQAAPLPLSMAIPGAVAKRVNCVPSRVLFPIDINYETMYETWTVELRAEDPRIYSDAGNNYDLMNYTPNGIGFNLAFNVNFGGSSGGGPSQNLINSGTFPTLPTVDIYGPVTNPVLRNVTTNQQIALSIALTGTDILSINFQARTIYLNGTASRYSSLLSGSSWWALQPGSNTIQFTGAGTSIVTKARVSYRDAWN